MISWLSHVESKHLVKPSCKFLFLLSHTPNRLHGPRPMLHEATSSRPVQGWRRPSVPVDQSWQPTAAWRSDGMVYISIYIYICVPIHTLYIFVGCPMGLILRDVCRIYGQWKEFSEICWYVQNMGVSKTLDLPSNMVSWCATIKYGC